MKRAFVLLVRLYLPTARHSWRKIIGGYRVIIIQVHHGEALFRPRQELVTGNGAVIVGIENVQPATLVARAALPAFV